MGSFDAVIIALNVFLDKVLAEEMPGRTKVFGSIYDNMEKEGTSDIWVSLKPPKSKLTY